MHELTTSLDIPIFEYQFFYALRLFSLYSLYIRMNMLMELFGFF